MESSLIISLDGLTTRGVQLAGTGMSIRRRQRLRGVKQREAVVYSVYRLSV